MFLLLQGCETSFTAVFEYPLENVNKECETSIPEQNIKQTSAATIAVVVSAVVIVMLAVISVIIIYFCFKKKISDVTL